MNNKIWFRKPATEWEEGMPIGNGRLGAMVLGEVGEEKIYLNEETIWYGGKKEHLNADASKYISEIRELLFEGKVEKAQTLARMALTSSPQYINPYIPGGYAWFFYGEHTGEYKDYTRKLDLDQAMVSVEYKCQNKAYRREYLTSHPDGVIAIHITCDEPKGLNFSVNLNRRPYDGKVWTIGSDTILMEGECGKEGIEFATALSATCKDGEVKTIGNFVNIQNATAATIYIATETSYRNEDYIEKASQKVQAAIDIGYEKIKKMHIKDYQALFNKSKLSLNAHTNEYPTDQLINLCRQGEDANHLMELIYNFGKYLLIASSRKGCLPSTLQGIWNESYTPKWESNYTININTQMNYWPAEVSNLSECHEPLFEFIERLCENGKVIARKMYGCNGSVAHHVSNIWAEAAPMGILSASPYWPMGLAWLSLHMYEHYRFTGDKEFLEKRCYPVINEVATFFTEYLVESPEGYLVTGPSVSPENSYISMGGEVGALCMGPTMDIQIIKEVFEAIKVSEKILEIETDLSAAIERVEAKLPPIRVGKHGQVMEWYQDYEEVELGHRHISHLFGLHPGNQITESKSPELFEAAKVTLQRRLENGGGHTGWSKAWIINFYARLLEGEKAYESIRGLLNTSVRNSLLDIHPPFQIDGNFGVCAAISEMLIQSHEEAIRILPALPACWQSGSLIGVCARGGFEIDIEWDEGKLKTLEVYSKCGNELNIYLEDIKQVVDERENAIQMTRGKGITKVKTRKDHRYKFILS